MRPLRLFLRCLVATAAAPARAHEGHDHGASPAIAAGLPRAVAQSDLFELVAVLSPDCAMTILLHRLKDNAPVKGAVGLTIEGQEIAAEYQVIGLFVARHALLATPGTRDIVFTVSAGEEMDLPTATQEIPPAPAASASAVGGLLALVKELPAQLGIGAGLLPLGLLLGRASVRSPLPPTVEETPVPAPAKPSLPRRVAALALLALLPAGAALAQATAASLPGEAPRRLDDGAIFVPKASQRLLTSRTRLSETGEASAAVRMVGTLVPEPGASGRVQLSQTGRLEPGERGQALAYVTPTYPGVAP